MKHGDQKLIFCSGSAFIDFFRNSCSICIIPFRDNNMPGCLRGFLSAALRLICQQISTYCDRTTEI